MSVETLNNNLSNEALYSKYSKEEWIAKHIFYITAKIVYLKFIFNSLVPPLNPIFILCSLCLGELFSPEVKDVAVSLIQVINWSTAFLTTLIFAPLQVSFFLILL